MEITLTLQEFLISFPAFSSTDANLMLQTIDQVLIETDGYNNLSKESISKLAVKLHVAHLLELSNRLTSQYAVGGQSVKKLKTKNDEIEFNVAQGSLYDFATTSYGQRLEALLDKNSVGFTWDSFGCCGGLY